MGGDGRDESALSGALELQERVNTEQFLYHKHQKTFNPNIIIKKRGVRYGEKNVYRTDWE